MLRCLLIMLMVVFVQALNAQQTEHILNGDFEDYNECPWRAGFYDNFVKDWYSPTASSPDYFHYCGEWKFNPNTMFHGAVQVPHSDSAFVGLALTRVNHNNRYREYIFQKMYEPLNPKANYILSFYVSLSEGSSYTTSSLQVHLSEDSIFVNNESSIPVIPTLSNSLSNYITDKVNWTKFEFEFTADSAYKYLYIGNFLNDTITPILNVGSPNPYVQGEFVYIMIDDVSLIAIENDFMIVGDTVICIGDIITLRAINNGLTDYEWYTNDDPDSIISTDFFLVISPDTITTYWVNNGNNKRSITVFVSNYPEPELGNDTIICEGEQVIFTPGSFFEYQWAEDSKSDSSIIVTDEKQYSVTVTNQYGCATADTVKLSYIECPEFDIDIPEALTPNGDGYNDYFTVFGENIEYYEIKIFNRWGEQVYYSNNLNELNDLNKGWDGYYKGVRQPLGTYVYIVNGIGNTCECVDPSIQRKGNLTLLR